MPFFTVEFSLAPSQLATHYNPTSRANLPSPDNSKVTTSSNANVSGATMKKRVAVRTPGNIVPR